MRRTAHRSPVRAPTRGVHRATPPRLSRTDWFDAGMFGEQGGAMPPDQLADPDTHAMEPISADQYEADTGQSAPGADGGGSSSDSDED
jgi:hypothetical protein